MNVVEGLYYSKDHEWVKVEGDTASIGITDYAQDSMGDIVYVELPEVGETFDMGQEFAVVESVKAAADIYMPVGGTVVSVNEGLDDEPELLNAEPFKQPIAVIKDVKAADLEKLMNAADYTAYCESLA